MIDRALAEDLSSGDPTTDSLIPADLRGRAALVAKAEGVLAGVEVAGRVFRTVDASVRYTPLLRDGSPLKPHDAATGAKGEVIAELEGPVSSILKAERTALNFLQRLSGIATETSRYVMQVVETGARILDTRKTAPGLRALDKHAVAVGGGTNHRRNLGDGILIKDNHIEAMARQGLGLTESIQKVRAGAPHTLKVEVEAEDLEQVKQALDAGADILLLDNMAVPKMAEAVKMARGRALTEASGGINLQNVAAVAATGVDLISVGALTHSARALDISLELL